MTAGNSERLTGLVNVFDPLIHVAPSSESVLAILMFPHNLIALDNEE